MLSEWYDLDGQVDGLMDEFLKACYFLVDAWYTFIGISNMSIFPDLLINVPVIYLGIN